MRRHPALVARSMLVTALAFSLLLAALPAPSPATAATCVVTSPADDGAGSLREKVTDFGCDTITFDDTISTVTLTSGGLAVPRDLTIEGRGVGGVRVERSAAPATPQFSIFTVEDAGLTLRGLTVANGFAVSTGGGVFAMQSTLTIESSVFTGNKASEQSVLFGYGGAIFATAGGGSTTITVTGSTFSGNSSGLDGGAIYFHSLPSDDGNDDAGASVTLTVKGSTFSDNTSVGSGGAISGQVLTGDLALTISNSTFSGNKALYSSAGAIAASFGHASDDNGGTPSAAGSVTVTGSTFSGNSAAGGGGAIITSSAYAPLPLTVTGSTFSGNSAKLFGGAISATAIGENTESSVTITHTTLADNTSGTGEGHHLALIGGSPLGGKVEGTATRSIFAHSQPTLAGQFILAANGSTFASNRYNVSQRDLPGMAGGDLANTDPLLDPLADNGGPTRTHMLQIGSPAIDHSPADFDCPSVDQRGGTRPQGAACDSGAVEVSYHTLTTGTAGAGTGTVSPATSAAREGATVDVSASPTGGSSFAGWTVDGTPVAGPNPLAVTMDQAHTIIANFAPPTFTLMLSTAGAGSGTASPAGATNYPQGAVVTLTASPAAGSTFAGWALDGTLVSWKPEVTLTMDKGHTVVATFQPTPTFGDVPAGASYADPVAQLAARGIINGCDKEAVPPLFCPGDPTLRHQMAALIARAMPGWADESAPNTFTDGTTDGELMARVATLQRYGVVRGYQAEVCQERGLTPPCYGPLDTVKHGQVLLFIARAMVEKGYWELQPDDRTIFPDQNGAIGADPNTDQQTRDHRMVVTYVHYVGAPPDVVNIHAPFQRGGVDNGGWGDDASRAWFTRAFWPVLQTYFGQDNLP